MSSRDEHTVITNNNTSKDFEALGYYPTREIAQKHRERMLSLALLVLTWYGSSVVAITTSKEIMNHVRLPFFLCTVQFLCASLFSWAYLSLGPSLLPWIAATTGSKISSSLFPYTTSQPQIHTQSQTHSQAASVFAIPAPLRGLVLGIASAYTLGFVLTNSAFSQVSAAFAETVKASEPLSTVAVGLLFFRESCSLRTYLTLVPVCCGVAFSCYHDDAFHWMGFALAFASNLCFSLRAVLAKRLTLFHGERLDEIQLFFHISSQGLLCLVPITLFYEADGLRKLFFSSYSSYGAAAAALSGSSPLGAGSLGSCLGVCGLFLLNGLTFATYNLVSYLVLRRTDLVTHSVLNAFRRVCVIVCTSVYFGLSLSALNLLGVGVAVCGVLAFGYYKARDNRC